MDNAIQINQLLLEREARLSDLYEIEQAVSRMLGQAYPFVQPCPLPSLKSKAKKRKKKPAKKRAFKLRKLDETREMAYRIFYTDQDIDREELHTDTSALQLLIDTPLPHLCIHRIETVTTRNDGEPASVATLFERPDKPAPSRVPPAIS